MEQKKSILIFLKSFESAQLCRAYVASNGNVLPAMSKEMSAFSAQHYSVEAVQLAKEFASTGWTVFFTCYEMLRTAADVNEMEVNGLRIEDGIWSKIDFEEIDVVIHRDVGSVEGKRYLIRNVLNNLAKKNPRALFVNDCKCFDFFSDKELYLKELLENRDRLDISVPKTFFFSKTAALSEMREKIDHSKQYIIKPTTGELSNSVADFSMVHQEWISLKSNKVGGWILQEFDEKIWAGEYRAIFVGRTLLYAVKKHYIRQRNMTIPSEKHRIFELIELSDQEKITAIKIRNHIYDAYGVQPMLWRLDYTLDDEQKVHLLEYEGLNPGVFARNLPVEIIKDTSTKIFDTINRHANT